MKKGILPDNLNIARVPTSLEFGKGNFFSKWLELMRPMHGLATREIDVLAALLQRRYELSKSITDETLLQKVVLSSESKREIRNMLEMSATHMNVVFNKFKQNKIIMEYSINKKYIPKLDINKTSYGLVFIFEFDAKK